MQKRRGDLKTPKGHFEISWPLVLHFKYSEKATNLKTSPSYFDVTICKLFQNFTKFKYVWPSQKTSTLCYILDCLRKIISFLFLRSFFFHSVKSSHKVLKDLRRTRGSKKHWCIKIQLSGGASQETWNPVISWAIFTA